MDLFSQHVAALERFSCDSEQPAQVGVGSKPSNRRILEAVLLSARRPVAIDELADIFDVDEMPTRGQLLSLIEEIADSFEGTGVELVEVASGFRLQTKKELAPWINKLWDDSPSRLSRAMMETLSIIAHRQPVTRSDIEHIRGVAVSSSIMHTLLENQWIKSLGQRDSMGRPTVYGTTKEFLNHFGFKSLKDLPELKDLKELLNQAETPASPEP
ncbi:SMC-Scp complex subunit ScpB [Microbulbifer epialgicus]|uniref:SMC-Scp complex subunit ScpB n=1 Tax=Microbulbifer epialgicus TaxID=393907 RepID=A0ABV4NVC3_9GAMM